MKEGHRYDFPIRTRRSQIYFIEFLSPQLSCKNYTFVNNFSMMIETKQFTFGLKLGTALLLCKPHLVSIVIYLWHCG